MTGESWAEMVARPIMDEYASAALYFVSYILVTSIVLVNVVIAVLLEKMVDQDEEEDDDEGDAAAEGDGGALAPPGAAAGDDGFPSAAFLSEVEAATVPGDAPPPTGRGGEHAHKEKGNNKGHGHAAPWSRAGGVRIPPGLNLIR